LLTIFLDLSKQPSGSGTLEDPYNWQDVLNFLETVDLGKQVEIWTIGSDQSLLSNRNRLLVENKSFSSTLEQRWEFVAYRPCEYNIPTVASAPPMLYSLPFIDFRGCRGMTLRFNRFRIVNGLETFLRLEDCRNCTIIFSNCGIDTHIAQLEGDASIMRMIDCYRMKVVFLNCSVVNDCPDLQPRSSAHVIETHSVYNDPTKAGLLDVGRTFDSTSPVRTFDSIGSGDLNHFYFVNNYFSGRYLVPVVNTDSYLTRIHKSNNTYRAVL
jgi:hypothetical protein